MPHSKNWRSESTDEVCGVTWDDRDDSAIPYGQGYDCVLPWEHDGPHRCGDFTWEK